MKPGDKFQGPSVSRRTFIASAALIPVAAIQGTPQAAAQTRAPVTILTAEQRGILGAFVDRLIPKDELGPSATECGVVEYIDGCLAEFLAAEKPSFLQGLAAVDEYARKLQGAPLAGLSAEKQDAVLTSIDNNGAPDLKAFFNRVRRLALEGMFGDPSYGGNKNFAGWDLIRYPGAKLMSTPQDQKMSVAPVPYRKALYTGKGGDHGH
jgi:gluconate 2-dehydrogenase subunit 3-like protein